jgi:hypothetical protein
MAKRLENFDEPGEQKKRTTEQGLKGGVRK